MIKNVIRQYCIIIVNFRLHNFLLLNSHANILSMKYWKLFKVKLYKLILKKNEFNALVTILMYY